MRKTIFLIVFLVLSSCAHSRTQSPERTLATASLEYEDLPCSADLLQRFGSPQKNSPQCKSFDLFSPSTRTWKTGVSCFLPSGLTLFIYSQSGALKMDVRGLSGRSFSPELEGSKGGDHLDTPSSCSDVSAAVFSYGSLRSAALQAQPLRLSTLQSSVALIASQDTCDKISEELNDYVALLRNEGRSASRLVCVPRSLMQGAAPSKIRLFLIDQKLQVDGLILVGSDLPPFKLLYKNPGGYDSRSNSDLPYGEWQSDFWDTPGFADGTYDMASVKRNSSWDYHQRVWVARWLNESLNNESISARFRIFLDRRKSYRPHVRQNFLFLQGAEGVLFHPGDYGFFTRKEYESRYSFVLDPSSLGNLDPTAQFLTATDLPLALSWSADFPFTAIEISDHGSPVAVGYLLPNQVLAVPRYPEMVFLNACNSGAWEAAGDPSRSFIANLLNSPQPPLAVTGTEIVTYVDTHSTDDSLFSPTFFGDWHAGESMGSRQTAVINGNIERWRSQRDDLGALVQQLLSSSSIFGDGTLEL